MVYVCIYDKLMINDDVSWENAFNKISDLNLDVDFLFDLRPFHTDDETVLTPQLM